MVVQAFLVEGKAGRGQIPKFVTPVTHLVVSLSPKPNEGPAPKQSPARRFSPQIESIYLPATGRRSPAEPGTELGSDTTQPWG